MRNCTSNLQIFSMSKTQSIVVQGQKVADLRIVHQKRNFALVDIGVLQRLVDNLSSASTDEVRERIVGKLNKCYSVEQLVDVMAEEVAFRRTLTGLQDVDIQDLEAPEPKENGATSVPR
jgi:hypothetical protein